MNLQHLRTSITESSNHSPAESPQREKKFGNDGTPNTYRRKFSRISQSPSKY